MVTTIPNEFSVPQPVRFALWDWRAMMHDAAVAGIHRRDHHEQAVADAQAALSKAVRASLTLIPCNANLPPKEFRQ